MTVGLGIREFLDGNAIVGAPKAGPRRFWTSKEEQVLKENYEAQGVEGCITLLPGRSASSIYNRAGQLGLRKTRPSGSHNFRNQRWFSNDQIDAVIIRVVQGNPRLNMMKDLARTLNRPRWWVSKRATKLGLITPRFKEMPWTDAELELAAAHAGKTPKTIRKIMMSKGFVRTETAIMVKLKRTGIGTGRNGDDNHYTATGLSKILGVDNKTVTRWIINGLMKATKRGTARTEAQGGDEWWIHRRDVRTFIVGNVHAVDFRKLDKFWLVDLLTSREGT